MRIRSFKSFPIPHKNNNKNTECFGMISQLDLHIRKINLNISKPNHINNINSFQLCTC